MVLGYSWFSLVTDRQHQNAGKKDKGTGTGKERHDIFIVAQEVRDPAVSCNALLLLHDADEDVGRENGYCSEGKERERLIIMKHDEQESPSRDLKVDQLGQVIFWPGEGSGDRSYEQDNKPDNEFGSVEYLRSNLNPPADHQGKYR